MSCGFALQMLNDKKLQTTLSSGSLFLLQPDLKMLLPFAQIWINGSLTRKQAQSGWALCISSLLSYNAKNRQKHYEFTVSLCQLWDLSATYVQKQANDIDTVLVNVIAHSHVIIFFFKSVMSTTHGQLLIQLQQDNMIVYGRPFQGRFLAYTVANQAITSGTKYKGAIAIHC